MGESVFLREQIFLIDREVRDIGGRDRKKGKKEKGRQMIKEVRI